MLDYIAGELPPSKELEEENIDNDSTVSPTKKLKYPKSIIFIVGDKFCERFCYYGIRTILSIYLTDMLLYDEPGAKVVYHTFSMFVYIVPLFGAILSDSLLGKFKTIFYISMIYAIGATVLAVSAAPELNLPANEFTLIALTLIAIGTGGIKPCVIAFGGDQFILPQQHAQLATFFSMFYFSYTIGSFLSTIISPILRQSQCFGRETCFTLAFGLPAAIVILSIIIFLIGRPFYLVRKPEGNVVVLVTKCIANALSVKCKTKTKKQHWLDHAEPKYGESLVSDIKGTLRVLFLYIPLPLFWALYDQQATSWTFQARRMDGNIGFYTILPDQVQVINPLLILIFIPLFQYFLYPTLTKCKLLRKPLQRMVAGGILAAISFRWICLVIEAEAPIIPTVGNGQIRIFNTLPCEVTFSASMLSSDAITIKSLDFNSLMDIKISGPDDIFCIVSGSCYPAQEVQLDLSEKESVGYYFANPTKKPTEFPVKVGKLLKGWPLITTLVYVDDPQSTGREVTVDYRGAFVVYGDNVETKELKPNIYEVYINGMQMKTVEFKLGGIYVNIVTQKPDKSFDMNIVIVTPSNSIHMLWMIPQYVVLAMGEIMFSVTGMEFAYSQSPNSMKSVMQAAWLLNTAIGNLVVVVVEAGKIFPTVSMDSFFYAALMFFDMICFALMAMRYKYVQQENQYEGDHETKAQLVKVTKEKRGTPQARRGRSQSITTGLTGII